MFLDGLLIPASELVNFTTIVRSDDGGEIDYFHLELADHDIILAEGAESESYFDFENRWTFENAAEYVALYPDQRGGNVREVAPRLEHGAAVDAVRARLAKRAALLGTAAPNFHTITLESAGVLRAIVPPDVTALRLLSGSGTSEGDRRRLGALLLSVRLDGVSLSVADPRLLAGFHLPERHNNQLVRWTNGDGVLALAPRPNSQTVELEIGAVFALGQQDRPQRRARSSRSATWSVCSSLGDGAVSCDRMVHQ
jgi:hypothetical protein